MWHAWTRPCATPTRFWQGLFTGEGFKEQTNKRLTIQMLFRPFLSDFNKIIDKILLVWFKKTEEKEENWSKLSQKKKTNTIVYRLFVVCEQDPSFEGTFSASCPGQLVQIHHFCFLLCCSNNNVSVWLPTSRDFRRLINAAFPGAWMDSRLDGCYEKVSLTTEICIQSVRLRHLLSTRFFIAEWIIQEFPDCCWHKSVFVLEIQTAPTGSRGQRIIRWCWRRKCS